MDPFFVSSDEVQAWIESDSTAQPPLSWHKDEKLKRAVSSFHERFARQTVRLELARSKHTALIGELFNHLKAKGIPVHPEYVGSAYEGIKVAKTAENDDLEFYVLVTIKLPTSWKVCIKDVPNVAGHVFLSLSEGYMYSPGQRKTFFDNILTPENDCSPNGAQFLIDGEKTIVKFFGELRNWIDASPDRKGRIRLRLHGPAVQMDVYEQKINSDRPYYTVDVVLTLVVETSEEKVLYVAKPVKSRKMPDSFAWRLLSSTELKFSEPYFDDRVDRFTPTSAAFSPREKAALYGPLCGCLKMVLRVLKVLRNQEVGLDPLTSYHLKTVMLWLQSALDPSQECR